MGADVCANCGEAGHWKNECPNPPNPTKVAAGQQKGGKKGGGKSKGGSKGFGSASYYPSAKEGFKGMKGKGQAKGMKGKGKG